MQDSRNYPERIGRYRILGELATGGMAQILLGKYEGARSFERPIVIKRILPHLAGDPDFTAMFVDEARITARIRHPNVAQVHELEREGNELYLVMEYLEGESLSALLRRLQDVDRPLSPGLAAHVVAEACAGLHAAHEQRDEEDRPVGLVHRDVSPQNLFVGYDGSVRVLDFGIAKAEGREVRTQTGTLKGKAAYMSPEQCLGEPLDRRTDVFALGVVLWELCTQQRLFKRGSELMVLKAIVEDPVVPPSAVATACPSALDVVCLRSLQRDREARYPSMAAMRADLLGAARELDLGGEGRDLLGALMGELFAARIEEKRELLRRVGKGELPPAVPPGEPATELDRPPAPRASPSPPVPSGEAPTPPPGAVSLGEVLKPSLEALSLAGASRARRANAVWIVATALLAGASLAVLLIWLGRPGSASSAPMAPMAPSTRPSTTPPAPSGAPQATVLVHFESDPSGATVTIGDAAVGQTPLDRQVPTGDLTTRYTLRLAGFEPAAGDVVPDRDQRVARSLVRLSPPTASAVGRRATPRPRPPAEPPAPAPASTSTSTSTSAPTSPAPIKPWM